MSLFKIDSMKKIIFLLTLSLLMIPSFVSAEEFCRFENHDEVTCVSATSIKFLDEYKNKDSRQACYDYINQTYPKRTEGEISCALFPGLEGCQITCLELTDRQSCLDGDEGPACAITAQNAATQIQQDFPTLKKPVINIRIPQLEFSDINQNFTQEADAVYLHVPWIAEYVSAFYKFALGAISVVAVLYIIITGIQITVGGSGSKKVGEASVSNRVEGYKKIGRIVLGLCIAWGSYVILYNINPDLVEFKALKIEYVKRDDLETEAEDDQNDAIDILYVAKEKACDSLDSCRELCTKPKTEWPAYTAGMARPDEVISIPNNIPGVKSAVSGMKLKSQTISALIKAGEAADDSDYTLLVVSSYRPLADQIQKVCDKFTAKKETDIGKTVAWPGGSNHGQGIAVDIHLIKDGKHLTSKDMTDELINKLEEIMRAGGFYRYCREWWHFEIGTAGTPWRPQPGLFCPRPYSTESKTKPQ